MWRVVQASAAGTSHLAREEPCQDACWSGPLYSPHGEAALFCVVSDGAGSARFGGEGSHAACSHLVDAIRTTYLLNAPTHLEEEHVRYWVDAAREQLTLEAQAAEAPVREFACTLAAALITPQQSVFFQVGDGAIVASRNGVSGVVFFPEPGEYANITDFLTDDDLSETLMISFAPGAVEELALFTDGIQRLALSFQSKLPHLPFFAPMFERLRCTAPDGCEALSAQLEEFLSSPGVNARTDDDKTLVLATRIVDDALSLHPLGTAPDARP